MPIAWAGMVNDGGDLPAEDQKKVREYLDAFGESVADELESRGLTRFASPLFRLFNLAVGKNPDSSYNIVFGSLTGGIATYRWLSVIGGRMPLERLVAEIRQQLGWDVNAAFAFTSLDRRRVRPLARSYVDEIASATNMAKLGNMEAVAYLRPYLEAFLSDYPDPERTVFVMMPFGDSPHLQDALTGIQDAVSAVGLTALRADSKAYSDQLWTNVETYLVACKYGIAVFEDLDQRDFNPNVTLELGYMLGLRKRCLLLKEKRLPKMPSDVVGHLYKPWDAFDAQATVARQVERWLQTDLGIT